MFQLQEELRPDLRRQCPSIARNYLHHRPISNGRKCRSAVETIINQNFLQSMTHLIPRAPSSSKVGSGSLNIRDQDLRGLL